MKVIVNADDFGANKIINDATIQCAKDGFLTSATILTVASHFEEAVSACRDLPDVSFGVHLALTGDFEALSLGKKMNQCNWGFTGINIFKVPKIVREFSMQIEKLQAAGIAISHIDTHHHIHRFPLVLMAVVCVARKYNIRKVRSQRMVEIKSFPNRTYRYIHHKISALMGLHQCEYYTDFTYFDKRQAEIESEDAVVEVNDEYFFNEDFYQRFKSKLINYNAL